MECEGVRRCKVSVSCGHSIFSFQKSGMVGQQLKVEISEQNQLSEIQMAYCMAGNFVGEFILADWQF